VVCFSYTAVDKNRTLMKQADAEVRKSRLQRMALALLADCFAVFCCIKKAGLDKRKRGFLISW